VFCLRQTERMNHFKQKQIFKIIFFCITGNKLRKEMAKIGISNLAMSYIHRNNSWGMSRFHKVQFLKAFHVIKKAVHLFKSCY
jgi:hypothetical protein